MDRAPVEARAAVAREATFLGAIQFPAGVLREQAGTDDIVDLILLAKPESGVPDGSVPFTPTVQVTIDGFITTINQPFDDHPDDMLASICPALWPPSVDL